MELLTEQDFKVISDALDHRLEHYSNLLQDPNRSLAAKIANFPFICSIYELQQKVNRIRTEVGKNMKNPIDADEIT